ncbi:Ankyrin repeat protein [Aspergillus sp. HF37]|nr:Ankyrin repeat protein [Aspergillus sp. HF37]
MPYLTAEPMSIKGQLIHHAVERDDGVIEVLRLLLGKSALLNASLHEQHRASWNSQCFMGLGTPLHGAVVLGKRDVVVFLLEEGADTYVRDSKGRSPVDCARPYGHPELVELLLVR